MNKSDTWTLVLVGFLIVVLVNLPSEKAIEPQEIVHLNESLQQPDFKFDSIGSSIYPSHPIWGWVIFFSGLILLYLGTRKILNV